MPISDRPDEGGPLQYVAEMARCIGTQNWSGLAALYDPAYQGRRGLTRCQSAEEEIVRLREETAAEGLTLKTYELVPQVVSPGASRARMSVGERLELAWPDGCRRVTSRQIEQCWHRSGDGWRLGGAEVLPASERVHCEAALMHPIEAALREAQRCLQPGAAVPCAPRLSAALAARICEDIVLPARLTVAVEAPNSPPAVAIALRRASSAVMEAWNDSISNVVELVESAAQRRPDIVIRGWNGPVFGDALGFYLPAPLIRRTRRKARRAELLISLFERTGQRALCLSPDDLFITVCHELGHCFGLGDCTHEGRVMAYSHCMAPPPQPPFLIERRAVVRWLALAHSLLAEAYQQLGRGSRAAAAGERAAALESAAQQAPGRQPSPACGLLAETSYASAMVRQYWEGVAAARRGRLEQALAHFDRVLTEGVCPELLLRRAPTQPTTQCRTADLRAAAGLDPAWLYAHECLLDWLEHRGQRGEAADERRRGHSLRLRAEIERCLLVANMSGIPWEVASVLLRATALSLRLSYTALRSRLGCR